MTAPILHTGEKGTAYGWQVLKCRCDECEAANQEKKRKQRPEGRPRGGQIRELPPHGTRPRYNHKREPCRCAECREANRLAHYFYTDGTPKPERKVDPKPKAVQSTRTGERVARAKPLRIVGLSDKPKTVKPRTYEPEAADLCGLDLPHGGFCMKRLPCPRPEHQ